VNVREAAEDRLNRLLDVRIEMDGIDEEPVAMGNRQVSNGSAEILHSLAEILSPMSSHQDDLVLVGFKHIAQDGTELLDPLMRRMFPHAVTGQ